ncbi:MAG: SpoIIE family protein phosphatase [Fulvivirga sp.]|nr:SpoIIE family protein phosphatase [Fulvivirga sp.]
MQLWNKLINIGVHPGLSPAEERKVRLINGILFIGEMLLLILVIKSMILGVPEEWSVQLAGAFMFLIPIAFNYLRLYQLARVLCLLVPYAYLSALTIYWGSERGSQLILFACAGLSVLFFEDKRVVYGMIILGALCLIGVEIYNFNHAPIYETEQLHSAYLINIAITIIMLAVISRIFRRESEKFQNRIQNKNHQLTRQREQLLKLNSQLENSLNFIRWQTDYAKTIQNSILPLGKDMKKAFKEHFVLFQPKDVVSGDFYFFSQRGQKVFVAAVDCTGHGVPGAFMSLIGYNLLLEAIEMKEIDNPALILEYIDWRIHYTLNQEQTLNQDGMDLSLCMIDYSTYELVFAGAKNPLLLIRRDGNSELIKGDPHAIGGFSEGFSKSYTNHKLHLNEIDTFYLYSDGFQDQFGGTRNKKFMSKRFRQLLIDNSTKDLKVQRKDLDEKLEAWKGNEEQTDDILVMGIKPYAHSDISVEAVKPQQVPR